MALAIKRAGKEKGLNRFILVMKLIKGAENTALFKDSRLTKAVIILCQGFKKYLVIRDKYPVSLRIRPNLKISPSMIFQDTGSLPQK